MFSAVSLRLDKAQENLTPLLFQPGGLDQLPVRGADYRVTWLTNPMDSNLKAPMLSYVGKHK